MRWPRSLCTAGGMDGPATSRPVGCVVLSLPNAPAPAGGMAWDGETAYAATGDLAGLLHLQCEHANCPSLQLNGTSYTDGFATLYDLQHAAQSPLVQSG